MNKKELSRMLFESREVASMYQDIIRNQMGASDPWLANLIYRIDLFRLNQGWNPHGFGDED